MKSINKYLLIFSALLISSISLKGQSRNVVWAHGFAEPTSIWAVYDNLFQSERMMNDGRAFTGTRIDYTADDLNGVQASAVAAEASMAGILSAPGEATHPQNMGIGHSMGGLVLREIDRDQNTNVVRLGGLITVGSPNYGAGILNSLQDGLVTTALQDGCSRLTAGPISQLLIFPFSLGSGVYSDQVCNMFWDSWLAPTLSIPQGYLTQGHTDLRVGSDYLTNANNGLNKYNSNIPRISIWGNENSPTHWRTASSFLSNGTSDMTIVNEVNKYQRFYRNLIWTNVAIAQFYRFIALWRPISHVFSVNHMHRANQWRKGYKWIKDSETIWNSLTRCSSPFTISFNTSENLFLNCINQNGLAWLSCMESQGCVQGNYDFSNCWGTRSVTRAVLANGPSDGVVCKPSQILIDIPQEGSPLPNVYQARGVNHQDETDTRFMQNNAGPGGMPEEVMDKLFNEIWDRPIGDFFRTEER